jgi:predicted nucleic acid-binding protein
MNTVFVDTAALIALGNQRDTLHEQALEIRR